MTKHVVNYKDLYKIIRDIKPGDEVDLFVDHLPIDISGFPCGQGPPVTIRTHLLETGVTKSISDPPAPRLEIRSVSEDFWLKVVEWDDDKGDELVINCGPYEAEARLTVAEARQVMEFIRAWLDSLPAPPIEETTVPLTPAMADDVARLIKVRLGYNDWPMEGHDLYGHYLRREVFDVIRTCKSGLIQIRDANGRLFSVPKRNLEIVDETTDAMKNDALIEVREYEARWTLDEAWTAAGVAKRAGDEIARLRHGLDTVPEMSSRRDHWLEVAREKDTEIERLQRREAGARKILEPMAEYDPEIREWLK